jgi:hypothetical protein
MVALESGSLPMRRVAAQGASILRHQRNNAPDGGAGLARAAEGATFGLKRSSETIFLWRRLVNFAMGTEGVTGPNTLRIDAVEGGTYAACSLYSTPYRVLVRLR